MQTNLSRFTAVIGIDWADKKHDVCVQDMATGRRRVTVLYLIDPSTLAYRRKTFTPSGAKDDPTDAECALKLLLTNPLAERLSCASNLLGDRLHRRPSRRMR